MNTLSPMKYTVPAPKKGRPPRIAELSDLRAEDRAELLSELWRVISQDDDARAAMIAASLEFDAQRLESLLAELEG